MNPRYDGDWNRSIVWLATVHRYLGRAGAQEASHVTCTARAIRSFFYQRTAEASFTVERIQMSHRNSMVLE